MSRQDSGRSGTSRSVSLDVSKMRHTSPAAVVYENPNAHDNDQLTPGPKRQVSEPASKSDACQPFPSSTLSDRIASSKEMVKTTAATFFGVNPETEESDYKMWQERRLRLLSRKCGKIKHTTSHRAYTTPCSDKHPTAQGEDVADGAEADYCLDDKVKIDSQIEEFRKPPVYKLTFKGLGHVTNTLKKKLTTQRKPKDESLEAEELDDDIFESVDDDFFVSQKRERASSEVPDGPRLPSQRLSSSDVFYYDTPKGVVYKSAQKILEEERAAKHWLVKDKKTGESVIERSLIETIMDNSVRRVYGIGYIGQVFNTKHRKDLSKEQKEALDHLDDSRPYFTYWITTVQILIMFITLFAYGFGTFGATRTQITGLVLMSTLSLQQVDYFEPDNFWLGPRAADLIHLGAKYSPCMRRDLLIFNEILRERDEERNTACCIRNDEAGCVQTTQDKCSPLLATWYKWSDQNRGPEMYRPVRKSRMFGTVCGQDPRYCKEPPSIVPYEWPDDLTKWPICLKKDNSTKGSFANDKHMSCEIVGRPCCIGTHGECKITTQEYCDFVKGSFHEEANLCSQVSCMNDVCGMIPFYSRDKPDQFYRLWTSLFLHAGILHLIPTIVFQYFIMRDLEKLTGSLRMAVIYMGSGVGGNLVSAIFIPYRAEVGPAGAQFGLLACMMVEVANSRDILESPKRALLQLCCIAIIFFVGGLFPWVDNYAHIGGFVVGVLLSLIFVPYVTISSYKRRMKITQIWLSSIVVVVLIFGLLMVFYVHPIYDCPFCKYLNCIPFTDHWCANQDIEIKRVDIL